MKMALSRIAAGLFAESRVRPFANAAESIFPQGRRNAHLSGREGRFLRRA